MTFWKTGIFHDMALFYEAGKALEEANEAPPAPDIL